MDKYFAIALSFLLLVSCKKEVVVYDGLPNEQFELPLILKLNGKECFYDESNGLLKYSLEENACGDFRPYTEFQAYSTIVLDGKALKNKSENDLDIIELHKRYSLEITVRGKTKHLQLEFTDMPLIRIVSFDKIANEPKTLAKMTLNYAEEDKISDIHWIGIELRGASSLSFDKKSYGIGVYSDKSTDHSVACSFFNLKENSKWILDAMYIDKGRCRNKTSFSLWASMGETSAHPYIHSVFTEVFLNNKSIGLYCFNENFSEELLDLNKQSVFYNGLDNSEVTYFNRLPEQEPTSARWGDWGQKFPNPSKHLVWGDFKALSNLIVKGTDAEFTQSIGSLIDLDNVIDYYLFINLCGGTDNLGKNWHFLKKSPADKFLIVPWDLDGTWGKNTVGEPHNLNVLSNRFFDRLKDLNPENYNQRIRQRWTQLRSNQFSEAHILALFDDNFSRLQHYGILQTENNLWHQSLGIEQEQAYVESWVINRLAYLDELFL